MSKQQTVFRGHTLDSKGVKCELSVEVKDLNEFLHSGNKTIVASVLIKTQESSRKSA